MDWMSVRYFTPQEFACKCGMCGGEEKTDPQLVILMDELRARLGRPVRITSGYRCPEHPAEAAKSQPGSHSAGMAADISVSGGIEKFEVVEAALKLGFVGIGVANTFIHVDVGHPYANRPAMWTYS